MPALSLRAHVKTLHINGTDLHYVEQGQGEPVVFVHGGMADFRSWLPQVPVFAERYRVVSYSRRAFYPNAVPPDYDASMQQHIDDLAALIDALKPGSVHLVANSYGGYICLHFAVQFPEKVRSLALAEPPVQPLLERLPGGLEMLERIRASYWVPSREAFERGNAEEGVRRFLDGAVGPGIFDAMPERARHALARNAPEMAVATRAPFEEFMPDFTCEDARRIQVPVLLLRGEHSHHMYYLINDELARCLPYSEQALIEDAAHVLNTHNAEKHDRVVLDFLSRVPQLTRSMAEQQGYTPTS
jgi:pimeloyl-ACP methyl ester carboxylesterase